MMMIAPFRGISSAIRNAMAETKNFGNCAIVSLPARALASPKCVPTPADKAVTVNLDIIGTPMDIVYTIGNVRIMIMMIAQIIHVDVAKNVFEIQNNASLSHVPNSVVSR